MVAEPIDFGVRRRQMSEQDYQERNPSVAVPLSYLHLLKGDARAALFLAQVLYHQTYLGDEEGWFYHTLSQWEAELGFSDAAEARCCKTLARYGLQTEVRALAGTPKKHYHVDTDKLQEHLDAAKHFRESGKCKPTNKAASGDISEKVGNGGSTSEKVGNVPPQKVGNAFPRKSEILLRDQDLRDQQGEESNIAPPGEKSPASRRATSPPPDEKSPKERPRNPYWDALEAGIGHPPPPSKEGAWGTAIKDIKKMHGSPQDIIERCAVFRVRKPQLDLTATALASCWYDVDPTKQTNGGSPNGKVPSRHPADNRGIPARGSSESQSDIRARLKNRAPS